MYLHNKTDSYQNPPFFKPKQNRTALVIKIIKTGTKTKIKEKINLRGREGNPVATSGGDTGNKHRQRQWCGCNEKRESYEKTLKEEKTRPGSIAGGGGGVG